MTASGLSPADMRELFELQNKFEAAVPTVLRLIPARRAVVGQWWSDVEAMPEPEQLEFLRDFGRRFQGAVDLFHMHNSPEEDHTAQAELRRSRPSAVAADILMNLSRDERGYGSDDTIDEEICEVSIAQERGPLTPALTHGTSAESDAEANDDDDDDDEADRGAAGALVQITSDSDGEGSYAEAEARTRRVRIPATPRRAHRPAINGCGVTNRVLEISPLAKITCAEDQETEAPSESSCSKRRKTGKSSGRL
ncbi:uncharacterized protein KY384_000915 [Bacidia gigantensis]|uniref:uncharacterized protein n=1 Tax=Bacidia gigantensis TaxID=2732470 RepID=UPI001D03EEE3|nr:uncharacterized protein KY384_000915 [Bacidia gigantensis]KAG8534072.1 hypothetical protein KY384_000915 [Bacidia gigantensis]